MSEVYGIMKSAQRIADKGYGKSVFGKPDAEDFYINLKKAIESEYNLQGFCELIDNILLGLNPGIDGVVYCAIANAGKRQNYKKGDSRYIPLRGIQPISWNQVMFGQFQYDVRGVWNEIIECRKRGQENHSNIIKKMLSNKTGISDRDQASDVIQKANKEGDNIISDANSKASEIIAEAEKDASVLRQNLYIQQREFKSECEKEIAALIEQNQKTLAKSEEVHDLMCSKTNELQVAWMKSLTSATEQLIALKEEFYKHLRAWQQNLYPSEYEQLAERYIELYRIIDLDQIISEAMVDADKNSAVLNKLQLLDKSLRIFLHKFETSLNGLGLYVYRAEIGDDFDYVWHMNEDDSIDCSEKKIVKCITPGVAKRVQGDDEDDVIIPALVSV